jgi:hypothetical protein
MACVKKIFAPVGERYAARKTREKPPRLRRAIYVWNDGKVVAETP